MQASSHPTDERIADREASAPNRFSDLIDGIDGIVWEADPATLRFSFVSAQAVRILGYRVEEWLAQDFWAAHIHPDDQAQVLHARNTQMRAGIDHVLEYRMLTSDGQVVWLKDSARIELHDGQTPLMRGIMMDITEHKRQVQALQEDYALLQLVIDKIPCGVSLIDANLEVVLFNQRARKILDMPSGLCETKGTPIEQLFRFNAERGDYGSGDPEVLVHERMKLVRCNEAHVMERMRPDGTVVEIHGVPLDGGGFVTIYFDVTQDKAIEATLARESASLKAVLAHLPQGISVFDENLRLRHWNAGMAEALSLPSELITAGAYFDDLIRVRAQRGQYGPGAPETHVTRMHALVAQFQPHQFERTEPSGKTYLVSGKPMRIDGQTAGFVTTYTDITERKRVEETLRLSGTVFENSMEGIMVTDSALRILKVNHVFCAISGYSAEELVGNTPAILKSGRQDAAFYQAMWKSIQEQGYWKGELWNRRKNGEVYAEHLSISQVLDANGAIANYIGTASDISQYKEAQNQIARLSYYDGMTGLPNRALLQDRLEHALLNAEHNGRCVALLAIDLERMAHVNDTFGHHVGDQLLASVAERLLAAVRPMDTVSRHVGDEFMVILEDLADSQEAASLAERILAELAEPFALDRHELNVGACIGIGVYPEDGKTPLMLLKNADIALHHAKESGAGRFQFFREDMNAASMERLLIESSLRLALRRDELRVFYQPQVELGTDRITGMEALVRWQHPELGLVSPARFIPIAEETGQIIGIGRWVLLEACRQTRQWHDQGYGYLQVAVNVSARQFNQDDFAEQVKSILRETGLPPEKLELELTESLIMQRPERVVAVMEELRAFGVKFSIDDFGTGYSSLSQLKRFPIDKLKIDQSFTQDIGADANGSTITSAIIALGRSMRLMVVAEGVETGEQQRFLATNGCQGMQGYLFSRPVPAVDFEDLLARHTDAGHHIGTERR